MRPVQRAQRHIPALTVIAALALAGCAPVYRSRPGGKGIVLVRVALFHNLQQAVIAGNDTMRISDASHEGTLAPGESWRVFALDGRLAATTARNTFVAQIDGALKLWSKTGVLINGKRINAPVELRPEAGGGVLVIAELPLEEYAAGVVNAELGMVKPEEIDAARAQAIASRSYACAKLGSKPATPACRNALWRAGTAGAGYDLESTVSEQVFDPDKPMNPVILKAVRETEGMVLVCEGSVIAANYHSCCGGRTSFASEVWNADDGNFPYIKSVRDRYCKGSPKYVWSDTIAVGEITYQLFDSLAVVYDVSIADKGPSYRAAVLKIRSTTGDTMLYKDKIRFGLTSHNILSTKFDLACQRDEAGNVSAVVLKGFGYGHGVGLCQWGAIGMAREGKSYRKILKQYYKDVKIEKLY
ncbi:MAG: SpoIID/LytB domain-containing protein [Candidatus Edwardsbacteria bacterium]|nr:SpoIID/LytB domain-containing protein [Candidatus Edwardsbacteria bacterium]